jgi:hypothetical protein
MRASLGSSTQSGRVIGSPQVRSCGSASPRPAGLLGLIELVSLRRATVHPPQVSWLAGNPAPPVLPKSTLANVPQTCAPLVAMGATNAPFAPPLAPCAIQLADGAALPLDARRSPRCWSRLGLVWAVVTHAVPWVAVVAAQTGVVVGGHLDFNGDVSGAEWAHGDDDADVRPTAVREPESDADGRRRARPSDDGRSRHRQRLPPSSDGSWRNRITRIVEKSDVERSRRYALSQSFKTAAFNRSATLPRLAQILRARAAPLPGSKLALPFPGRGGRAAEGTRLLSEYGVKTPSRVRIPPSPPRLDVGSTAARVQSPIDPGAPGSSSQSVASAKPRPARTPLACARCSFSP